MITPPEDFFRPRDLYEEHRRQLEENERHLFQANGIPTQYHQTDDSKYVDAMRWWNNQPSYKQMSLNTKYFGSPELWESDELTPKDIYKIWIYEK